MSGRWSPAGTDYQQETADPQETVGQQESADPQEAADPQQTADGGYFASLAPAKYVQVTTFGRDDRPVPARVHGVVDGGRAYFRARSWSGTVKRLRHADAVKVAPCGALGMCYGPPLHAAARLLPAEETSRAAAELARKYPARRSWLHRMRRPKMVHYELVAGDAPDEDDTSPQDRGGRSGAARDGRGPGPLRVARTHVTDHGAGSIACIWPAPAPGRLRQRPGG